MDNRCIGFVPLKDMNTPWREVLHLGQSRHYSKGEHVFQGEHLHFLEKGLVRLTHSSRDGKEKILWYIKAGCIFDETPFFDPLSGVSESIHVCAADSEIYAFSPECVHGVIAKQRPDLIINLLFSLARKVRLLSNQASSLSVDEVFIRVCKFLGRRIVPDSSPPCIKPGISRQEMANLLGIHRITLFKILKQMEDSKIFAPYDRGSFVVLQPEVFFQMVES